jgi:hypothetical protein
MHWQCVAPDGDDGENKRDAVRFRADRCHVDELCRAIRVCGPFTKGWRLRRIAERRSLFRGQLPLILSSGQILHTRVWSASLMPHFLLVICGLAGLTYMGKQIGRLFHGWKRIL